MRKLGAGLVVAVTLVACSSDPDRFTDCKLGQLTGTWRVSYTERDGNCGRIADETVSLSAATAAEAQSKCTYAVNTVSADRCQAEQDFTCALTGAKGTQRWVGTLRHATERTLSGRYTVQVTGDVTCRGTYETFWTPN